MDIEGAEYDALLGLESIIQRDRPHLAVSVYHKPDDMWKIGLWLHAKFGSMYSFYLRKLRSYHLYATSALSNVS